MTSNIALQLEWAQSPSDRKKKQHTKPRDITVGRIKLRTTEVFETYWRFAAERQALYFRRLRGESALTNDWIIAGHRFTNVYRATDRVSQYLISEIIPNSDGSADDIFFRTLLFKVFNRVSTWERLQSALGPLHASNFDVTAYDAVLTQLLNAGERVYSSAYIMPSPKFGFERKHSNHLTLLKTLLNERFAEKLRDAATMRDAYDMLRACPSFGSFLAFQFLIDLNYGPLLDFSENDFVVAGPGAIDGIRKCFSDIGDAAYEDVIAIMQDQAEKEFDRLGLEFTTLWGRPPQLIDCQNLFCEVDKYARYAHPTVTGVSGRSRIKQRFVPAGPLPKPTFPRKWKLVEQVQGLSFPRLI